MRKCTQVLPIGYCQLSGIANYSGCVQDQRGEPLQVRAPVGYGRRLPLPQKNVRYWVLELTISQSTGEKPSTTG